MVGDEQRISIEDGELRGYESFREVCDWYQRRILEEDPQDYCLQIVFGAVRRDGQEPKTRLDCVAVIGKVDGKEEGDPNEDLPSHWLQDP
jgi:hypothetical protein